jgi:hypothetical protein
MEKHAFPCHVVMRLIGVLIVLIAGLAASAQQVVVRGVVRDSLSNQPLEGVVVFVRQTGAFSETNAAGEYQLRFTLTRTSDVEVSAQLFGFVTATVSLKSLKNGTARTQDFTLSPRVFDQPAIVIRPGVPDTVWGDEMLAVSDFVWTDEGLVLLVSEKEKRWKKETEGKRTLYSGCRIIALDSAGKEIYRLGVPDDAEKLHLNCFDDVFVIGRSSAWWISTLDEPELVPMTMDEFETQISPLVDTINGKVVVSTWQPDYPAFEYKSWNPTDSSLTRLRYIVNEHVMELFRSSFKYLGPREKLEAFKFELRTGVEKEIVAGYMSGFSQSNYFEPMNAPLMIQGDRMLLFDHHHDYLVQFNAQGEAVDSTLIAYHKSASGKWSGKLIQDRDTGKVYTTIEKGGAITLHEIDAMDGTTHSVRKLHWPYVSRVAIRNGFAYYLYRPFESSQKHFLYREKL